jgi:uncharacterized membrane protein YkoI
MGELCSPAGNESTKSQYRNHRMLPMKAKHLITVAAAMLFAFGLGAGALQAADKEAKLEAKAKITKEQATKTALAKVPNGTIKEAELEKEKGKLIWSFDIATPGTKDITEVNVDAMTGEIVNVENEKASDEAKEEKSEKKEKK